MLEIRPCCENCNKDLPPNSTEAMICTFECTFCIDCIDNVMKNICPNCGGGFQKRPIRPRHHLVKHPAETKRLHKPINEEKFATLKQKYDKIHPSLR